MKKVLLLFFLCEILFGISFSELKNNISINNVYGDFNQSKIISGFNMPIKTSGSFRLYNNELFWYTKKPISSEIKINKDGIFLKENNTYKKTNDNGAKSIFIAIFSLDEKRLQKEFDIVLNGDHNSWNMILKPKNIFLKQIFDFIEIIGDKYIKKLIINEVSKDKTISEFFNIK